MTGSLSRARQGHTGIAMAAGILAIAVFAALSVKAEAAQFEPGTNGLITFTRNDGGDDDIFVMGNDGSNPTNLTPGNATGDAQPTFSPDGQTIVFNRGPDLFSMSSAGANQAPLNVTGFQPTFTPDGTRLVFSRNDGGDSDVFIANADGSNPVNLTGGSPVGDQNPNVSPDGTKIAFQSTRDGGDTDIFTMNIDGSNPTNLTPGNGTADINPSFSPNGASIAFQRDLGGVDFDIFTMNATGGNEVNLTLADPEFEAHPAFSPDGTRISFSRSDGVQQDVFVMNADGSGQTNLTPGNATSDREAEWQRLPLAAQCVVPDVVGQKKKKATAAIVAANCTVGATKKKFSKKVKKKKVIKTKPKAGTTLPAGSPVDLKVSKGPKK
jgi:Tol biopolymer transport system component